MNFSGSLKIRNSGGLSSVITTKAKGTTNKIMVMQRGTSTKYLLQEKGNRIVEEEIRRDF